MCGILGQIKFNKQLAFTPDLNDIAHRGPDGRGEWTSSSGAVYFGHTRLAIIEPTPAGRQPMNDASNRFTITFNGEIYNHQSLRGIVPGIEWRSTSDTETLVELLGFKGIDALPLLKGMFAFALHDREDGSVLLVRDRLGIKPLWVRQNPDAFYFSSEVRALVGSEEMSINPAALSEYISFGRMPDSDEVIDGISSIAPGGWMKVYTDGTIEKGIWWKVKQLPSNLHNKHQCIQRVNQLVRTAIQEHLISDVGVGAFLSGGIDSSIVTLVAGRILGQQFQTFTVGFPQKNFDERAIARIVAAKAGSEHVELEVDEDSCLKWVKEAVLSLDLPSVDAINTYIVSKAVTDTGLKVALSGLGGDELFGGYPSFRNVPILSFLEKLPGKLSRRIIDVMPAVLKDKLSGLTSFSISELTVARRRFTPIPRLESLDLNDGIPKLSPAPIGLDMMGKISWAEIQGYMIPMLLRDCDQMSMAVGLELRVPFLDHQLVEEVLYIKEKYKKGPGVKSLLVDAFRDDLPVEVYNRSKQGFSLPMHDWIKGPLAQFTDEGLMAAADFLHISEPLRLQKVFDQGNLHWTRLWNWCVLGHWLKAQGSIRLPDRYFPNITNLHGAESNYVER